MKNGKKVDAHSDARGARDVVDQSPTGLAVIATAWGKLSAPIREAVASIIADATGQTIQSGLVSIAAAWAKLQPEVKEAIRLIIADALSASTTTASVAEPAFTRGTFSVGELLGSGSEN